MHKTKKSEVYASDFFVGLIGVINFDVNHSQGVDCLTTGKPNAS